MSKITNNGFAGYSVKIRVISVSDLKDENLIKQESPAVADKPARRESMPKIAPIRRAYMYNVVAENTSFV